MSILSNEYKNSIAPALMTKFGYKSVMQIPKLEKVVINVGAGEAKENSKVIDAILRDLSPVRRQFPAAQRSRLRTSSSARVCRSVRR